MKNGMTELISLLHRNRSLVIIFEARFASGADQHFT